MSHSHSEDNEGLNNLQEAPQTQQVGREISGYPKLALHMSRFPESAVFRRFKELNMITLLRLQAELHDMEHQFQEVREEDSESGNLVRAMYTADFRLMRDWKESGDSLQYDLLVSIGDKLKQYNEALIQNSALDKVPAPNRREIDNLQNWLQRPSMGNNFLNDIEETLWLNPRTQEYIDLSPADLQKDYFTSLMKGILLDIYHRVWGHRRKQDSSPYPGTTFRQYDDDKIETISNSVSAILGSLLPTIAILVLYFVKRMLLRIGLVIVFTSIFSLALSLFTDAKRVEIFSATAAFAAVEVVFIGSTDT